MGSTAAVGSPLTARLRGGPVSSVAFLAVGQPSPISLPVGLSSTCTINVEIVTLDALVSVPTNADGGGQFTIDMPTNPGFCGQQFGWQYLWLDPATPSCPYVLTGGLNERGLPYVYRALNWATAHNLEQFVTPGKITVCELFFFVPLFNALYWCMLWARRRARVAATNKQTAV